MSEKITDAIMLYSTLFGSIYLFNSSLQRLTDLNRIQPKLLQFLDGCIVGATGFIIVITNLKALKLIK